MKAVLVLFAAMLFASVSARGQGFFIFDNRVITEGVNARFVLSNDPPGISSVGTDFQVQLFGGPEGTPSDQLLSLEPPSTGFRGAAGTATAGYVVSTTPIVPGVSPGLVATILVRASEGERWETANYRFEGLYSVRVIGGLPPPPVLPLGTSPLILYPIPEPSSLLLALLGMAFVGTQPCKHGRHTEPPTKRWHRRKRLKRNSRCQGTNCDTFSAGVIP